MSPREFLDCRLQLAVAEQDHQLRGAKCFERKCCLLVPCQHMQKKTGRGAYYFLLNAPISPLFACMIAQLVICHLGPAAACL
jgi:hypothetical protein